MEETDTKVTIARWESRTGRWWLDLYRDRYGYGYHASGPNGWMGQVTEEYALAAGERMAALAQPDAAKTPMRRVK